MGSAESTSNREDGFDFVEDSFVGQRRLCGFDLTFTGDLELIPVEVVGFGVLHNVWPSWNGVAAILNRILRGLGQ